MPASLKTVASWSVLLLLLMQFVPLRRINPPVEVELQLPNSVRTALKKACYDCHSNETRWQRIAYIAPVSWVISNTVASGRAALNFSNIGKADAMAAAAMKVRLQKVVLAGASHQPLYYRWQPEAKLNAGETAMLWEWVKE
jgi:hypothetical protein